MTGARIINPLVTAESEAKSTVARRARTASVNYPYHPLELCIPMAKAVSEIGNGRSEVSKSLLAQRLGVSEKGADFAQKIASSKTYGLLDGKTSLQLTEPCRSYFFPTSVDPQLEKRCLFAFLGSPGAFREIIQRFDGGKPPAPGIIANILGQEYGIPESWKLRIANFFLRSAAFVGAIGNDGFLRYNATIESLNIGGKAVEKAVVANLGPQTYEPTHPASPQHSNHVQAPRALPIQENLEGITVWTHGSRLRVETPENMTTEVWQKLNKYVQAMEPD